MKRRRLDCPLCVARQIPLRLLEEHLELAHQQELVIFHSRCRDCAGLIFTPYTLEMGFGMGFGILGRDILAHWHEAGGAQSHLLALILRGEAISQEPPF